MPRIPLIDVTTGRVENVIVAEYSDAPVPGFLMGPEGGEIGWQWDGAGYVNPNPPFPQPAPPATQQAPHVID